MGTWSIPLCAHPSGLKLNARKFSEAQKRWWSHQAFSFDAANADGMLTMDTFMDTECDTHKIYDYMCASMNKAWDHMLRMLHEENPEVLTIRLLFWCSDAIRPFEFSWHRGEQGENPTYFTDYAVGDPRWYKDGDDHDNYDGDEHVFYKDKCIKALLTTRVHSQDRHLLYTKDSGGPSFWRTSYPA